ncbi:MAG: hypothetical protein N3I35_10030 [Clostridia bacterium]|nr:hypothetical protein [Clostridia bacterium]
MFYLLWCTIRPNVFVNTYKYWMEMCKEKQNVKLLLAVNTEEQKREIMEEANCYGIYPIMEEDIIVIGNERKGLAYAAYCLTSRLQAREKDIVILSSDDFFPPKDWDQYLEEKFADFSGCILVRDGFHDFNRNETVPVTLPIMTFECLLKLNRIIYHPEYIQMFCDNELYLNVKELGLLKDVRATDRIIFEHRHYAVNKRSMDSIDLMYNSLWKTEEEKYERRRKLTLEERLKVIN